MKKILILLFAVLLTTSLFAQASEPLSGLENSVIIFIHGDGDYLFHSKKGQGFLADEVVLSKSIRAAEKLNNSEIFIFHQKKRTASFLFFKNDDLDFYFYKNGRMIEKTSLNRHNFQFGDEISFYRKYASPSRNRILLYYGHEIPVAGGSNYNVSYKTEPFNLSIFSNALKEFSQGKKFNLIVLSTCANGSPVVIKEIAPSADYIIASPDNLHLSYMNPFNLKKLNYYAGYNFEDFVVDFASSSFRELKKSVETSSTISAYKTSMLSKQFLKSINSANEIIPADIPSENCDCAEKPGFNSQEASAGVIVFYNPPSFGKDKFRFEHSGWGCKRSTTDTTEDISQLEHAGYSQNRVQAK